MNRFRKFGWLFLFAAFLIASQALTVQPQLSPDEQSVSVNAVDQTIPEAPASVRRRLKRGDGESGSCLVATMTMTPSQLR